MEKASRILVILSVAFLLLWLQLLAFPLAGQASTNSLAVKNMVLSIWPEYDEPGVLVIYSGQLVNRQEIPFAGLITFKVPLEVEEMRLVCESEAGLHCVIYQIAKRQRYKEVSWQATKPIPPGETMPFLLEFYYDPLPQDKAKTFEFTFFPSYPVGELLWDIKEPFDAEEFVIKPEMTHMGRDVFGFNTFQRKDFQVNEPATVNISYQREQQIPSIDRSQAISANVGNTIFTDETQKTNWQLALVLIGSFMSIIGFFAYYAYQNNGTKYH